MPPDPDDLTPQQRGKSPSPSELASRQGRSFSRMGRWARLRSWATVLVAILVLLVSYLLFRHVP
jgi:type VI protein secretion system component VasF